MKQKKPFSLDSLTQIKIFLLFLLDRLGYPIDYTTLIRMIAENAPTLSLDYEECIRALTDSGHLYCDTVDGERYYMISDTGRKVAAELYDTLEPALRERSERCAAKYLSLSARDAKIDSRIEALANGRFSVVMHITDPGGELLSVSLTVASRAEAEVARRNFEAKPEGVYRSVLYGLTGQIEYIP